MVLSPAFLPTWPTIHGGQFCCARHQDKGPATGELQLPAILFTFVHGSSHPHSLFGQVAFPKTLQPPKATQLLQGRQEETKTALGEKQEERDPGKKAPELGCNQTPEGRELHVQGRSPYCDAGGHLTSPSEPQLYCSCDRNVNQSLHLLLLLTQISWMNHCMLTRNKKPPRRRDCLQ